MSANPHANGGLLRKELKLPDFRDYAVPVHGARHDAAREHQAAGRIPARRDAQQPDDASASSVPTRPPPTGCRRSTRRARRPGWPTCCPRTPTAASWRATGASWRCSPSTRCSAGSRAICSPAATASSTPTKRSRTSSTRCSTSTPSGWTSARTTCKWRAPGGLGEHPAVVDGLAAGPQRLLAPGSRASSICVTNKSPSVTRIYLPPDANTLLVGRRPLPAQHRLHQRHRRRQAEAPAVHDHRRGDRPLHQGHRHLEARQHRRGRGARRRAGVAAATWPRWRRWRRRRSCASACPI